jgi:hypothetical protein
MSKASEKKVETISKEAALKALQEERQQRAGACQSEIAKVLEKHKCRIAVGIFVTERGNQPQVQIVAE